MSSSDIRQHLEGEDEEDFDDMPDLESVKSSEYFSSDNEEGPSHRHKVLQDELKEFESANFLIAQNWLRSGSFENILKDFQVLIVYTYSPFLYGDHVEPSYWDSQWFVWFKKANLISQRPFNLNELSIKDIRILEVFGITLDWCWSAFGPTQDATYLAAILDFWDQVKDSKSMESVIAQALELNWFVNIVDHIDKQSDDLGLCDKQLNDAQPHSIELCILYAVCHLGYQLVSKTGGNHKFQTDFAAKIKSANETHFNDIGNHLGRAEFSFLIYHHDYLEHYQNALRLSPFEISLYESRLQTHLMTAFYLGAASDSIRILCLQKDHKEAHFCLIKSLCEMKEETRCRHAKAKFYEHFSSPTDRETLERFLKNEYELTVTKPVIDSDSSDTLKSIHRTGKMGTDYYRKGDYDNAQLFFGACLKKAQENPQFRHSLTWKEGITFLLAVQYCYAQTLLNTEKYSAALEHFIGYERYSKLYPFPAAYLYTAICFVKQRRHTEAIEYINIGLKLCESCGYSSLYWPGTTDPISECLPQAVKVKLLQLQAQLLRDSECLTCRYPQCLNHNITTQIDKDDTDFKGYYLLKCSEKCSITFHPSCWKRQKNILVYTSDKSVLSEPCFTPDCPGHVTHVILYDSKGKSKIEFITDEIKAQQLQQLSDSKLQIIDTNTKSSQNHSKKSKVSRSDSGGSSDTSPSSSSSTTKSVKSLTIEQQITTTVVYDKHSPSVKQQQSIVEDLRNSKDSVGVIDRASEEKESKVKSKSNKKKKNKLSREEDVPNQNGCHWDDLFSLPQREGLVGESDTTQEFPSWEPDPANPFTVPEHLKEKVSKFEGKSAPAVENQEIKEDVGGDYPTHHQQTIPIPSPKETAADSTIYEFIISYFVEIFKEHGPLQLLDAVLASNLESLAEKEEFHKAVKPYGGLGNFLKHSPNFLTFESGPQTMIGLRGEDKEWKEGKVEKGGKKREENSKVLKTTKNDRGTPSLSEIAKQLEETTSDTVLLSVASNKDKSLSVNKTDSVLSKTDTQNSVPPKTQTHNSIPSETKKESLEPSVVLKKVINKGIQCSPVTVTTNSATQTKNTDKIMVTKSVGTPPLPVVESFKERYDEMRGRYDVLMKEKKSADSRLRMADDQRLKQQRQHAKEMDKSVKKCQNDMKKEMDTKLARSEELMREETEKYLREKKDINEQLKQAKNDLRQLNDRLNKLKKDFQKKEKEKTDISNTLQEEREENTKKLSTIEEQYKSQLEAMQQRAINAEVLLLTQRKEICVKPTEQRLQELERLCTYASQTVPGGDQELNTFKDQMVQTINAYKSNMDEQIDKLTKRLSELSQLENIPPPVSHMSPQLKSKVQLIQRSLLMSIQRSMSGLTGLPPQPTGLSPAVAPHTAPPTSLPSATAPPTVPKTTVAPPTSLQSAMALPSTVAPPTGSQTAVAPPPVPHTVLPIGAPSTSTGAPPTVPSLNNTGPSVPPGLSVSMAMAPPTLPPSIDLKPSVFPSANPSEQVIPTGMSLGTGIGPGMGPSTGIGLNGPGMGSVELQSTTGDMPTTNNDTAINQTSNLGPIGLPLRQMNTIGGMGMNFPGGMGMGLFAQGGIGMNPGGGMGMGPFSQMNQARMGMNPIGNMGMSLPNVMGQQLGYNQQQGLNNQGGIGMSLFNQPGMNQSMTSNAVGGNESNIDQIQGMKMGLTFGVPSSSIGHNTGISPVGAETSTGMGPIGTGMGPIGTGGGGGSINTLQQAAAATAVTSGTVPPKPSNERKNFDQLVSKLSPLYPSYTRDDFKRAVLELRKTTSLTGLPLESVIEKVKEVIDQKEGQQKVASLPGSIPAVATIQMPPIDSFAFSQPVHSNQGPMFRNNIPAGIFQSSPLLSHQPIEYNTDNNCIICYEDMFMADSTKLECGHRFHSHCIRSWLNEQSTCPTCRKHALLVEDFPRLH